MSTRVLPVGGYINYIRMSELRRRLQPPPVPVSQPEASQTQDQAPVPQTEQSVPSATAGGVHQTRSVRRNLFGPIDHEENLKFVQEELNKIADADSRRWNFDFQNDVPLEGRFTWENAIGATVPVAYEMPNLTSRLTHASPSPSTSKITNTIVTSSKLHKPTPSIMTSLAKVTEACSVANPLRSTLNSVTTASTTILSTVPKPQLVSEEGSFKAPLVTGTPKPQPPSKETLDQRKSLPKNSLTTINSKQTHITDFLKIRKRAHSPSETDSKTDDGPAPPLLKRARTST